MNLEREYNFSTSSLYDLGRKMLITKNINTKWNSKTKSYYESLGYQYTKMRDLFEVKVSDLKPSSSEKILIECDYCHKQFKVRYVAWLSSSINSIINKDSCFKCKYIKAREGVEKKYKTSNIMKIEGIKEKRDKTIQDIYGVENPFQSEYVKRKIRNTNLNKYGNESFVKTSLYIKKKTETCLRKYGATSWMKLKKYKDMVSGENSPVWKGGVHDIRWDRLQPKYKLWRISVFSRDNFTCQKCMKKANYLQAHHIFNWIDNPDKRYEKENGITFCKDCHIEFHRKYGKRYNTEKQLKTFLRKS